jgi:hypothetical protein
MMSMAEEKGSMLSGGSSCQHRGHRQLCAAIGFRGLNSPVRGFMRALDAQIGVFGRGGSAWSYQRNRL